MHSNVAPKSTEWSLNIGGEIITACDMGQALKNPPPLPEEVIQGILRKGGKMLVTAPSKAGKTFLMIELACTLATGKPWMNNHCVRKGKVLYVNMEVSEGEFIHRFKSVAEALHISPDAIANNVTAFHLRGAKIALVDIAEQIADGVKNNDCDVVILDPIYKLFQGSENDQKDVTAFCECLDIIANAGACVVYAHHHSKGAQGNRSARDRGSGSGVFARDVDALMDWLEVDPSECKRTSPDGIEALNGNTDAPPLALVSDDAVPYRVEWVVRSFRTPPTRGAWFDYPLHKYDTTGTVIKAKPISGPHKGGAATGEQTTKKHQNHLDQFVTYYSEGTTSVKEIASRLKLSTRTIKNYAKELEYQIKGDLILGPIGNGKQLEISS